MCSNFQQGIGNESNEFKEYVDRLLVRTSQLFQNLKLIKEQVVEIEVNLDRWQSKQDLGMMNILEGVDLAEQEWHVQEFISISMNLANILFIYERLELQSEKNYRMVKKCELQQLFENIKKLKK